MPSFSQTEKKLYAQPSLFSPVLAEDDGLCLLTLGRLPCKLRHSLQKFAVRHIMLTGYDGYLIQVYHGYL